MNTDNNHYPRQIIKSRIEAFKEEESDALEARDIMQDIKAELESDEAGEQ